MRHRDQHPHHTGWPKEEDALGRQIDAELAKYAAVEPRAGLETRVLTSLRAEAARAAERTWWRSRAVLAAAAMVLAVLSFRSGETSHPVVTKHLPTAAPAVERPGVRVGMELANDARRPLTRSTVNRIPHSAADPSVSAGPKLDQFPSPQPLSEQEVALTRYVSQFPQDATLIAQAQEEVEKEIEQEMDQTHPRIDDKSFDQQER